MASAAPTWRDASVALWLWSGVYLIFQSLISFGCGGYFAGRVRPPYASATVDIETRDGLHGVAAWALAVLIGAVLTALIAGAANRPSATTQPPPATEPSVLSYELDHLFRAPRRPPNVDLTSERAEAARILATASSHSGVLAEDRALSCSAGHGVDRAGSAGRRKAGRYNVGQCQERDPKGSCGEHYHCLLGGFGEEKRFYTV